VHAGVFVDGSVLPLLHGLARAALAADAIDAGQAEAWIADQDRRAAEGRTFFAVPLLMAAATRP
jgi:hypothetical protein